MERDHSCRSVFRPYHTEHRTRTKGDGLELREHPSVSTTAKTISRYVSWCGWKSRYFPELQVMMYLSCYFTWPSLRSSPTGTAATTHISSYRTRLIDHFCTHGAVIRHVECGIPRVGEVGERVLDRATSPLLIYSDFQNSILDCFFESSR